jgi:16S rRNA (guanine(966)-N(2))-methyltransferase RsmD
MRILSGSVRGKKLLSPEDLPLRPTCNKVRAALFNIIRFQLKGSLFLDLFAGTGAVGLNALSEGADSVTFVENNWQCVHALERNIVLSHLGDKARLVNENVFKFLEWENLENYNFIFLDPPYDMKFEQYINLYLKMHSHISKSCLIITEHTSNHSFESFSREFEFSWDEKKYGKIRLTIMQRI